MMTEAAAAKEAGLSPIIVIREGNAALNDEEKITYTTIKSFLDLTFQTSTKRQKVETANEKVEKDTTDVSEPMDTSEDVEIPNINDQKNEKNEDEKEVTESEETECLKSQLSQDTSISLPLKEEEMAIEKEPLNSEQETPIMGAEESSVKPKDKNEDTSSSGNAEETMKDDATVLATKSSDQIAIPEKTEKDLDTVTTEIIPTANKSLDVSISESVLKSENAPTSSEKKIKDSTDIAKNVQAELVNKTQMVEDDKKDNIEPQSCSQNCDKTTADKSEKCLTAEKDEVKEESKIVCGISESENVLTKNEQEEKKNQESTVVDFTENGETVQKATEKTIVTETEATTSTTDVKKEVTTEASTEKSLEAVAKTEKIDEKTPQETKETVVTDAEKRETETTKQEITKDEDTVKEENVMDMKDKNIVDSEKQQKLNGTAQNGNNKDVPVLDDKLHSNGLNEGTSKETTSEDAAAQNGEPESSSESSAESIKVKKVVDSTVVDGAGESDVVPPVVVAATS